MNGYKDRSIDGDNVCMCMCVGVSMFTMCVGVSESTQLFTAHPWIWANVCMCMCVGVS
jgi:hypothetical protein